MKPCVYGSLLEKMHLSTESDALLDLLPVWKLVVLWCSGGSDGSTWDKCCRHCVRYSVKNTIDLFS